MAATINTGGGGGFSTGAIGAGGVGSGIFRPLPPADGGRSAGRVDKLLGDPTRISRQPATLAEGSFSMIPTTNGPASVSAAAWFPLVVASVGDGKNYPFPVWLVGGLVTQAPADANGVGGGVGGTINPTAWGSTRGESACIVIGKNLPCTVPDTWVGGDIPSALFGGTVARTVRLGPDDRTVIPFPPGAYNDTVPGVRSLPIYFPGDGIEVKAGDTFGAALVLPASVYNTAKAGGGRFYGFASVCLWGVR